MPEDSDLNHDEPTETVNAASNKTDRANANQGLADVEIETEGDNDRWFDRSKSVAKRLDRIKRQLTRTFDQRMADQQAEYQRELRKRDDEIKRLREDTGTDAEDAAHEAELEKLQQAMTAALEAGESAEVARINVQISRLTAEHQQKKLAAHMGSDAGGERREKTRDTDTTTDDRKNAVAAKARAFIESNDDWYNDEEYAAERGAANALHDKLVKEGSDASRPEHYRELTRRLKKKFPNLPVELPRGMKSSYDDDDAEDTGDGDGDGDGSDNTARRSGMVSFRAQQNAKANAKPVNGRVKVSREEIEMLKTMGVLNAAEGTKEYNDAIVMFSQQKAQRMQREAQA